MASRKTLDLKAQKEKRQKKIAVVGAVLLVGILAVQVPRTMKLINPPDDAAAADAVPAAPTPVPATPAGAVPLAPPTAAGGGTAGGEAPASGAGAGDSDPAPLASGGQLVSFGRFASKDPFDQQVSAKPGPEPAPSPDGGAGSEADDGRGDEPAAGDGNGGTQGGGGPTPSQPAGATIAVDGVEEQVAVGADFPAAAPLFRLVSASKGAVRVAIAGGAFASGDATLTLERGETVTLVNTADGVRYELELVSVGA